MKPQQAKDIFLLNLAMLFISTSGVLGRYIEMPPEVTIFWRVSIAAVLLLGICRVQGISLFREGKKDAVIFFSGGALMMVHWVTYFYALKLSNVAVGMLSLFTYPVITAILEPLILKTPFRRIHLFLGLLTLAGIYLLSPETDLSGSNSKAIGLGLLSASAYALRNILMKNPIKQHNGTKLMFYQTIIATIFLLPFSVNFGIAGVFKQWWAVLFLALFTTVIGHTLFLMSLKRFSVTTAGIMSCTQPILGILLGVIFLQEIPNLLTVIGGGLILTAVFIETYIFKGS